MKLHKSITLERVEEAVREGIFGLANPGICVVCGADADCEPDARGYPCEECDEPGVFGAEELLLML